MSHAVHDIALHPRDVSSPHWKMLALLGKLPSPCGAYTTGPHTLPNGTGSATLEVCTRGWLRSKRRSTSIAQASSP